MWGNTADTSHFHVVGSHLGSGWVTYLWLTSPRRRQIDRCDCKTEVLQAWGVAGGLPEMKPKVNSVSKSSAFSWKSTHVHLKGLSAPAFLFNLYLLWSRNQETSRAYNKRTIKTSIFFCKQKNLRWPKVCWNMTVTLICACWTSTRNIHFPLDIKLWLWVLVFV